MREAGLDAAGSISMWEDPAEAIGAFAGKVEADLVIVGHHRRSALDRWWRGSVGHSSSTNCRAACSFPCRAKRQTTLLDHFS
ncbi:universal stress protein [Noviherbaspirillum malthae]|uniref:universal stress protein n=1 Tax=Noviherbaspirillum malthae TaxID=1260987 RepID=UPI0034DD8CE5